MMELITSITSSGYFSWLILPVLIFCSRILDVSLGTLRIIFVSRGKKAVAPFLGFFEVFIWLVVITNIMANANNLICYIAYAAGFATGNFVGILLEEKLAIGMLSVKIFVSDELVHMLTQQLCEEGFGVTSVRGAGKLSDTNIMHCIIRRKEYDKLAGIIKGIDGNLFYYAEDLKQVRNGIFLSACKKK